MPRQARLPPPQREATTQLFSFPYPPAPASTANAPALFVVCFADFLVWDHCADSLSWSLLLSFFSYLFPIAPPHIFRATVFFLLQPRSFPLFVPFPCRPPLRSPLLISVAVSLPFFPPLSRNDFFSTKSDVCWVGCLSRVQKPCPSLTKCRPDSFCVKPVRFPSARLF